MADLEALFVEPGSDFRRGWRYELPVGRPIRLGRVPGEADWVMESDKTISGCHVTVVWDGVKLDVKENQARPPRSRGVFKDQRLADFVVSPGESFLLGKTQFTVRNPDDDSNSSDGANAAPPAHERTLSDDDIGGQTSGPSMAMVPPRVFEEAARAVRVARTEGAMRQQLLRALLETLPWVEGAGLVAMPPEAAGGRPRLEVRETIVRTVGPEDLTGHKRFHPSRRLVAKSLEEKKCCLHIWKEGEPVSVAVESLAGNPPQFQGGTPWAICTPLPAVRHHVLYAGGTMPPAVVRGADPVARLADHQKLVQAFAHLVDARSIGFRQAAQAQLLRDFCPRPLQPYLDDPDGVKEILSPQVVDATVLFCDLRGFTRQSEMGGASLMETWGRLRSPVNEMSSAITLHGGVVAGFQGDAVLGFWGWPQSQQSKADQIRKAAEAAVRIHEVVTQWLKGFHCGIGVAHGPVVAGRLGALDLAKVDVFGPTVNLASRLEGLTKLLGVPILVDGEVADSLREEVGRAEVPARLLGRLVPKGMTQPVVVAELLSRSAADAFDPGHRHSWEEAVEWFNSGSWAEAHDRLSTEFIEDPVAKFLLGQIAAGGANWANGFRTPANWAERGRAVWVSEK